MMMMATLSAIAAHIRSTLAPHSLSSLLMHMASIIRLCLINAPSLTASAMTSSTAAPQISVQMPRKKAMEKQREEKKKLKAVGKVIDGLFEEVMLCVVRSEDGLTKEKVSTR